MWNWIKDVFTGRWRKQREAEKRKAELVRREAEMRKRLERWPPPPPAGYQPAPRQRATNPNPPPRDPSGRRVRSETTPTRAVDDSSWSYIPSPREPYQAPVITESYSSGGGGEFVGGGASGGWGSSSDSSSSSSYDSGSSSDSGSSCSSD